VKKPFEEWFLQSDYDFGTAEAMYDSGRYVYCVFMCHLAIEKALKALIVKRLEQVPSKTHNLIYLIESLALSLPDEMFKIAYKLNDASIPTRYPDELYKVLNEFSRDVTFGLLNDTRRILEWIKKQ